MQMRHWFFFSLTLLGGCNLAPDQRPGMWQATGVNERNIQSMLADPADYYRGRESAGTDGNSAAQAIERYRTDKVKPLRQASEKSFEPGGDTSASSRTESAGGN